MSRAATPRAFRTPQPDEDVRSVLHDVAGHLRTAGVPSPQVDAELLVCHAYGVTRAELLQASILRRPLGALGDDAGLASLVTRRAAREPLQHLTGRAPFRTVELAVGPGVFVPRPETEQVAQVAIDEVLARVRAAGTARVVDLCTGSGAIALAVATEVPGAEVWAVELDGAAHAWAERNLDGTGVHLVRGDARTALSELDGTCDVVVSNPPYVPPGAVPREPEVADHDPAVALYGLGADGLEVPRGISDAAARLLRPGGLLVLEHAEVQSAAARAMVLDTGVLVGPRTLPDLAGRDRMVVARRDAPVDVADSPS